ncbi:MAG: hypothetical protein ACRDAP_06645, partial [Shewanella sp.]
MHPKQPPPTAVNTGSGQPITQTTSTATPGTSGTTVVQAAVSVSNTASQPQTNRAAARSGVARQSGTQTARFHPYDNGERGQTVAEASVAASSALDPSASPSATQQVSEASSSGVTYSTVLAVHKGRDLYPTAHLYAFFNALFKHIGLKWNGQYTKSTGGDTANLGDVGRGAVSSLSLHFSTKKINECQCPSLRELLLRINEESEADWRTFLLVKALRAFCETGSLWDGVFSAFGFLLNINPHSVKSWMKTLPVGTPTVVDRTASADGPLSATAMAASLSIPMPMHLLSLPEIVRFLVSRFSMQLAPPEAQTQSQTAATNSAPNTTPAAQALIMRLSFTNEFIHQQDPRLGALMQAFNGVQVMEERSRFLARIICVAKESLPFGIYSRICQLLNVPTSGISGWCSDYKKTDYFRQMIASAMPRAQLT